MFLRGDQAKVTAPSDCIMWLAPNVRYTDDDDDMALEVMESPTEDNTAFSLTDRCVTKANKGS